MNPLQISPEMLNEFAMELGTPLEIAKKYGLSDLEFLKLSGNPWFERAVKERRAQMEAEGFTFHAKMAMMAETLLVDTWRAAQQSESVALKLEVAKHLAKLGRLEPQPNQNLVAQTGGFQLTIHFSKPPEGYEGETLQSGAKNTIDITPGIVEPTEDQDPNALAPPVPRFAKKLALENYAFEYVDPEE